MCKFWDCTYPHRNTLPADTRRWNNVGLTLVYLLRRWPNVKPRLIQRLVSARLAITPQEYTCTLWTIINVPCRCPQNNERCVYLVCHQTNICLYVCGCKIIGQIQRSFLHCAVLSGYFNRHVVLYSDSIFMSLLISDSICASSLQIGQFE